MKAVIFDMDGLLLDSEQQYLDVCKTLLPELGFEYEKSIITGCIGMNSTDTKTYITSRFDSTFDYKKFNELLSKRVHENQKNLKLKYYAKETLVLCKNKGYKTALATSTCEKDATFFMKHFGLFDLFDARVFGDMVTHSKPNPEIFLKASTLLNVKPEETYVLEDSYAGITAGYEGGFFTVMIPDILKPNETINHKIKALYNNLEEFCDNHLNK